VREVARVPILAGSEPGSSSSQLCFVESVLLVGESGKRLRNASRRLFAAQQSRTGA
jgi:hypothetical protein